MFSCNVYGCATRNKLKAEPQALIPPLVATPPVRKPKVGPTEHGLRIIKVEMGNEKGDGMDGGFFGNKNWGGGRFIFKFCFQYQCCSTGILKTEDDNWEQGEINYFVGYQIKSCENFPVDSEGTTLSFEPKNIHFLQFFYTYHTKLPHNDSFYVHIY